MKIGIFEYVGTFQIQWLDYQWLAIQAWLVKNLRRNVK